MKRSHLLTLILLISFTSRAQLDLAGCLKMADTANLSIRAARLNVAINDKQIDVYNAARLPKLTFTADYKYNAIIPGQVIPAQIFGGAPGTFATVQFGVPFNLSNTIQLTQLLYNPQVNYAIKALNLSQDATELQQQIAEQEIHYQVATTFFNLQAMNRQISFLEENLANMDKLINQTNLVAKQGLILEIEVDKIRINRLNLQQNMQVLKSNREQLNGLMKILIGMKDSETLQLTGDELVEKGMNLESGSVRHPELELLDTQLKLNKEERKGTKMAYLPGLSFYAAYNYTYNLKPESDFRTGIEGAFLGLRLDWTLFDGMEKAQTLRKNAISLQKIEAEREQLSRQLEWQTSNAQRQITVQKEALKVAGEQVQLADKVAKQVRVQFEQGIVSSSDVIQADNALTQAQSNQVTAYIQLRQAELTYLKSIGNIK